MTELDRLRRKRVQRAAAVAFARMGEPMPPPPVSVQGAATVSPIVHAPPMQVLDGRGVLTETMGGVAVEPAPAPRVGPAPRPRMGRPALRR